MRFSFEKNLPVSADALYGAIVDGRLFLNCGAWPGSLKIDSREGGLYEFEFGSGNRITGQFTMLTPGKSLKFSWCQTGASDAEKVPTPETQVSIALEAQGAKSCRLQLHHDGFATRELAQDHASGWNEGIEGLVRELEGSRVRLSRTFEVPVGRLYRTISQGALFRYFPGFEPQGFEFREGAKFDYKLAGADFIKGEFARIEPERLVVFGWESLAANAPTGPTEARVYLTQLSDGTSRLDLLHQGFPTYAAARDHRQGWGDILDTLAKAT